MQAEQQLALAGVRGEEHGAVGDRQLGVGEPGRAGRPGCVAMRAGGREGRLLEVEGVERAAAGVPERDDRVEAPLAQEHHARPRRRAAPARAPGSGRCSPTGCAGSRPPRPACSSNGHQRVVGDVLARVHQAHDRARARHRRPARRARVAPSAVVSSCTVVTVARRAARRRRSRRPASAAARGLVLTGFHAQRVLVVLDDPRRRGPRPPRRCTRRRAGTRWPAGR